ncbi:MAG TPA: hypothetical protein VFR18_00955 [Terriglobia bacterium]|nr:hypothetical protein [Terriglobia bacterium]
MKKPILVIALIDLGLYLIGNLAAALFEHNGFLAFAIGAIAIVTFFGSLKLEMPERQEAPPSGDAYIRRALAIAIVVMYLLLVATFAFFVPPPPLEGLLMNFTTTTGVVIAFYFGSSAFIDARRHRAPKG